MLPAEPWRSIEISIVVLLAIVALHWGLWRLARRLPVLIARGGAQRAPLVQLRWRRSLELLFLPLKVALWAAGLYLIAELFPVLVAARAGLLRVLQLSFTRPLITAKDRQFSALDILLLPVAFLALWLVVSLVTRLFRVGVLQATRLQAGVQESLTSVLRYALLLIGAVVILQVWGFDASTLTVFGSLLGVGIGFGLQNIANNFISGILIGVERPIKPGDFVEVGGYTGTVQRVGGRSTSIRTLDRVTILVPNSRFLETEVVNWSHADPISRIRVPVSIAYGSPPMKVRVALLGVARGHAEVLSDPWPEVQLVSFGDSAVNYELLVWTRHPQLQNQLRSDLNLAIQGALARHGLEIPFPQHDLHLRSSHLDRLVDRLGRSSLGVDEEPLVPTLTAVHDPESLAAPSTGRTWSGEELEALVARMRAPGGVTIADRRHLLSFFPRCFLGSDAAEWLQLNEGMSRHEALALGNQMLERGLLHHVLDEHLFEDRALFYRFYADETLDPAQPAIDG